MADKKMVEERSFLICKECRDTPILEGAILFESSCDAFQYCSMCGRYSSYFRESSIKSAEVELIEEEECDCIEKHGSIIHNDGGNYHITSFRILKILKKV